MKPEGWKANFAPISSFLNKIIHSESAMEKKQDYDSDNEVEGNDFGHEEVHFGGGGALFGGGDHFGRRAHFGGRGHFGGHNDE